MYTLNFKNKISTEKQAIFEEISYAVLGTVKIKLDSIILNKKPFDTVHENLLIEFFDDCSNEIDKINTASKSNNKIDTLFDQYNKHAVLKNKFKFAAWFGFINKITENYIATENASLSREKIIDYFYETKLVKNTTENKDAINDLITILHKSNIIIRGRKSKIFYFDGSIKLDPSFFFLLKENPKMHIIKMMRSMFPTHLVLYPFLAENIDNTIDTRAIKNFSMEVLENVATKNRPKFQYLHELNNKIQ